jgi:hypothetical protein
MKNNFLSNCIQKRIQYIYSPPPPNFKNIIIYKFFSKKEFKFIFVIFIILKKKIKYIFNLINNINLFFTLFKILCMYIYFLIKLIN